MPLLSPNISEAIVVEAVSVGCEPVKTTAPILTSSVEPGGDACTTPPTFQLLPVLQVEDVLPVQSNVEHIAIFVKTDININNKQYLMIIFTVQGFADLNMVWSHFSGRIT